MTVGDQEYRRLIHRYCELLERMRLGTLTDAEREEKAGIGKQLDEAEMKHRRQSTIAAIASDYADLAQTGHLGGVEL